MSERHKPPEILVTHDQLSARVAEMASEIVAFYQGDNPYIIAIANGAAYFGVDLHRALFDRGIDTVFEMVHVASYGDMQESNRAPSLDPRFYALPLRNERVLIVDDVLDTGLTVNLVVDEAHKQGALHIWPRHLWHESLNVVDRYLLRRISSVSISASDGLREMASIPPTKVAADAT